MCAFCFWESRDAQTVRPTHGGTIWTFFFIHVKPGMGPAYDKYLASDWKKDRKPLKPRE